MNQENLEGQPQRDRRWMQARSIALAAFVLVGAVWSIRHVDASHASIQNNNRPEASQIQKNHYPWHKRIFATIFWVGEDADESNAYISNSPSAWIEDWKAAYGGVDDPENRCGSEPCAFKPKENPFYFALPFNDRQDGDPKPESILRHIPWYTGGETPNVSWVKNRWIEISHGKDKAYAQWEDVGPLNEDDTNYVFGGAQPKFRKSGLDLSPATSDYLHLNGHERVDWRFIDGNDVPDGPWKNLVTTSPAQY